MNFRTMHENQEPLLIANVWDVPSSKAAEKLGFASIGTSSGAIASLLGYQDGEEMSFSELEYIVKRITDNTSLPLTVDLEAGYSRDPQQIIENIVKLSVLGVRGINLEDSLVVSGRRNIVTKDDFTKILDKVVRGIREIEIFINVRTDTFLLGLDEPVSETIERAKSYAEVGANGLFVPCIQKEKDIEAVVAAVDLPINVMCMPQLPAFNTLSKLGVKRISMGNFLFDNMYKQYEQSLLDISKAQTFKSIFVNE